MTSIDSSIGTEPVQDPAAEPGRRPARRRVIEVAVALAATVGLAVLRPDPDTFCTRVHDLPSIATLGDDGTPSAALAADATALEQVAAAAPDDATAQAARALADHQARLGQAVAGASSSDEIVTDVESLDPASLASARDTLDRAITRRCS
jgi:hypothetical protein